MQPPGRRALAAKKRRRGREARAGAAAWTQATSRGGRQLRRLSEDVSGPLDPRFRGPHSFTLRCGRGSSKDHVQIPDGGCERWAI